MFSIRYRLGYRIILSMVLVMTVMSGLIYFQVVAHVEQVFDRALHDKANALISLTELDEEGLEFDFAEKGVMREYVDGEDLQYYQLWEQGKHELIRSPSLGEEASLPRVGVDLEQEYFADLRLVDGRAGRLIEARFMPRVEFDEEETGELEEDGAEAWVPPTAKPILMVIARERETLDDTLAAVAWSIVMLNALLILIAAALIWKLVGRGLSPLSRLAQQVAAIDESHLDARLAQSGEQSREITPIQNQLNHLLERLQAAFEREKRFSANVAHELRTPLAELRTLAEVGPMVPDDQAQIEGFFRDVGDISGQMEKVVITLLELTRSEAGLLQYDPVDIALRPFCERIWKQAVNGTNRSKTLLNEVPANLLVHSDQDKLGMILGNLFTNAVFYSPIQAEVVVRTTEQNGRLVLEVQNSTTDLKPEDVVHMKDRFWRKDKAARQSGHSGLGLTLVDALARIMEMEINLKLDEQGILRVSVAGLQPA